MPTKAQEMIPASELKARGWTDSIIKRFAGEPDELKPNPHRRSGPPMRLYSLKRIKRIEKGKRFTQAMQESESRKAAARKAAETRHQKTQELVSAVEFHIPTMPEDELIKRACEAYNGRNSEKGNVAGPDDDWTFINRITLNCIRHELTAYDAILQNIKGRTGNREAYETMRDYLDGKIEDAYPFLDTRAVRRDAYA